MLTEWNFSHFRGQYIDLSFLSSCQSVIKETRASWLHSDSQQEAINFASLYPVAVPTNRLADYLWTRVTRQGQTRPDKHSRQQTVTSFHNTDVCLQLQFKRLLFNLMYLRFCGYDSLIDSYCFPYRQECFLMIKLSSCNFISSCNNDHDISNSPPYQDRRF